MTSNDDQDCHYLLEWVNKERTSLGQCLPWYSLSQVRDGEFFGSILTKLDPKFFADYPSDNFEYDGTLRRIEEYLDKAMGNKIKRRFRTKMLEEECPRQLILVLFYICVQSSQKSEFIHRIFELPSDTQAKLMNDLKNIEEKVESILEIKDILRKLEQLEEENEMLREQLKENSYKNCSLTESLKQNEEERMKLSTECTVYKKEKDTVFEELGLTDFKEYAAIYHEIKAQNEELTLTVQMLEAKNTNLESNSKQMKEKIKQDNSVITHLNEEITKLKTLYQNAWLEISYYEENFKETNALKENKVIGNTRSRQSFGKNSQRDSFASNSVEGEQGLDSDPIRQYNSELMKKLEQSYRRVNSLTEENSELRQEIKSFAKDNCFLNKKIEDLRTYHQSFVSSYGLTLEE